VDVYEYLEAHKDEILREVLEFASIPSISTDANYKAEVARAARWVAAQLTEAGPLEPQVIETKGHPVVYAEWLGAPGKPTVLVYGYYDVQPPDPLGKWLSPPFSPTIRDERIYARGVSDDKAPLLTTIKVAQAFFASEVVYRSMSSFFSRVKKRWEVRISKVLSVNTPNSSGRISLSPLTARCGGPIHPP